ncbi:hypothetical protein CLTEP_15100 [Clostridium tepidiprofundi DSM 19306]|uniref:Bacteriophage peptidoglycan hydrolase n=1 Tax=Clostridium tepidiprofundi DSM 19306 TaxID=1121338 RepID=A0A151B496_9CLOT|nr:hypothetical protein [Clostridium tepidiprofundi]KYH34582.1 hypothetical protein CLTEP_15100 [Clostridium tepidiprofundi DSM 19306]
MRNNINKKDESLKKLYNQDKGKFNNIEYLNKKLKSKKNFENSDEVQKYIKEMQEMEDKNERRTNVIATIILASLVLIIGGLSTKIFFIKSNTTQYTANSTVASNIISDDKNSSEEDTSNKQAVSNNTDTKSDSKSDNHNDATKQDSSVSTPFNQKLYKYLLNDTNRTVSLKNAIDLNQGKNTGMTILFLSELMRNSGLDVPKNTCNTSQLVSYLKSKGWKAYYDYHKLEKGDVCFTTNLVGMKSVPSHAYIFMGWVEDGKTDYAYVCDGQVSEYKKTIHIRNIDFATKTKDKFNFFMRK